MPGRKHEGRQRPFHCSYLLMAVAGAQHPHHVVVVYRRRRAAAGDPIEQIGVGAIEQGFESVQLHGAELIGGPFGERAEDQVDFLCPTMPAAKQQALAADLGVVASRSGSSTDITHDYPHQCAGMGIMLLLRFAMIQTDPVMTRKTIQKPKARGRKLLVVSEPLPRCSKDTRGTPIWAE